MVKLEPMKIGQWPKMVLNLQVYNIGCFGRPRDSILDKKGVRYLAVVYPD